MKKVKQLIVAVSLVGFALAGCEGQTKSGTTEETKSEPTTSKETAISIFKDLVRLEPINCLVTTIDNKECIICLANKTGVENNNNTFYSNPDIVYYKLSKFADAWRVEKQAPVYNEEFIYCKFFNDFEIATIDNKPYLYFLFQTSPMGNAVSYTDLNFSLFSLTDFQLTILDYGGDPVYDKNDKLQQIKGDFINIDKLKNKPELSKYLEDKASNSALVYRATDSDLAMDNAENYEKKWQIDNSGIKSVWDLRENTFDEPLHTTYYDKNIFSTDESYISSKIENDKYTIVSLFRNNILGYDKTKKKYFPIWVESCSHGCNKSISFISDTILKIVYSEAGNETITVDLANMSYKITLK